MRINKYLLAIPVFLLCGILAVLFVDRWQRGVQEMDKTRQQLYSSARQQIHTFHASLNGQFALLDAFAAFAADQNVNAAILQPAMASVARVSLFERIFLTFPDGSTRNDQEKPLDLGDRPYVAQALAGKHVIARVDRAKLSAAPRFILAVPIRRGDAVIGIVGASYRETALRDLFVSESFGNAGYSVLMDAKGRCLVASNEPGFPLKERVGDPRTPLDLLAAMEEASSPEDQEELAVMREDLAQGRAGHVVCTVGGVRQIAVYEPVGVEDWFLLECVPYSVFADEVMQGTRNGWYRAAAILILALVSTVLMLVSGRRSLKALQLREAMFSAAAQHGARELFTYDVYTRVLVREDKLPDGSAMPFRMENTPDSLLASGIIPPDGETACREFFARFHQGAPTARAIFRHRSDKGAYRWYAMEGTTIFGDDGLPAQVIISAQDITEQREKDIAYDRWRKSIKSLPTPTFRLQEYNLTTGVRDYEEGGLLPHLAENACKSFDDQLDYLEPFIHPDDRRSFRDFLNRDSLLARYQQERFEGSCDVRMRNAEGDYFWTRITMHLAAYPDSKDVRLDLLYLDVDESKRDEISLRLRSEEDGLTRALNRSAFIEKVAALFGHDAATAQHALIMVDIDGFKFVNDSLGHATGDEALVAVADVFRTALRHGDLLGRFGGDEFIVCLRDIPYVSVVEKRLEQLRRQICRRLGAEVRISGSIGVSLYPRDGSTFEELYQKADAAMYAVKTAGGDGVAFYAEGMQSGLGDITPFDNPPEVFDDEDDAPEDGAASPGGAASASDAAPGAETASPADADASGVPDAAAAAPGTAPASGAPGVFGASGGASSSAPAAPAPSAAPAPPAAPAGAIPVGASIISPVGRRILAPLSQKKTILVVDDMEMAREELRVMLAAEYKVLTAPGGFQALQMIRRYGQGLAVVLLDIRMPGVDGYEVLRRMAEHKLLPVVPVVAMSTDDSYGLEALELGASDFVGKPVRYPVLCLRLRNTIQKRENERLQAQNSYLLLQGEEEERYRAVLKNTGTVIFEYDWLNKIFIYDSLVTEYLAGTYDSRPLWRILLLDRVASVKDVKTLQTLAFHVATERKVRSEETAVQLMTPAGEAHWFRVCIVKIMDRFDLTSKLLFTFNDIHTEKLAQERQRFLAERDQLTELYNRETFVRLAEERLTGAQPASHFLAYLDVDNFKTINDLFGYVEGNRLLCHIAHELAGALGKNALCSRLSSDIFAVLAPFNGDMRQADTARLCIDRIKAFNLPFDIVSRFGIYSIEDPGMSVEAMLDRAALACKSIKGKYGVYWAVYDEALRDQLLKKQEISSMMGAALQQGQFVVHLQPQYDYAARRVVGAEALVRWQHPDRGLIPPGDFIPIFEENGFIFKLDMFVCEAVCRILRAWLDAGLPPVPVGVNISRMDIYHANFVAILTGIAARYNIPPELLKLELTESAYAVDAKQLIDTLAELRRQGYTIEMDDFGSGYSSFSNLKDLPVDVLKLDMNFLFRDDDTGRGGEILRAVIILAQGLGLKLISEGVETTEQAENLMTHQCQVMQGYLFGKPMPVPDFEKTCLGKEG